ncbi:MAG: ABC transporter permease [Clostridiales bacterium]|nr:ABC transporter permease [Clostridiales bacterium]
MKGKNTSFRFRKAAGLLLCVMGVLCLFYGLRLCGMLQENPAASVFLSGTYPDQGQVAEILEKESRAELPTDACFYWDGGISVLQSIKYGTQKEAMVCGLLGDASLYDRRVQGFSKEDREGCVIDEKTSYALFGSREAVGSEILLNGKTYIVRDTISWKQPAILIRPTDSKTLYTRAFVRPQQGETKKNAGEAFLLRNGLSGISTQNMELSKDWIPGKWSDFSFWSEKWKELSESFQMYLILPKTPEEAEQIVRVFQAGAAFLGTLLLCLLGRSVIIKGAKTNEGGLSSGVPGKKNFRKRGN